MLQTVKFRAITIYRVSFSSNMLYCNLERCDDELCHNEFLLKHDRIVLYEESPCDVKAFCDVQHLNESLVLCHQANDAIAIVGATPCQSALVPRR